MKLALRPEGSGRYSVSPRTAESIAGLRSEIEARVRQIEGWFAPAGRDLTAREVAAIFAVMAVKGMGDGEADAMMGVYVSDLADLPYFALSGACKQFRTGELGDGRWAPTPGEICKAARKLTEGPLAEKSTLLAITSAEIQKPQISAGRKAEIIAATRAAAEASRMDTEMREILR